MASSVSSPTMASLKAEGVELFKQRRYDEAVKKFTQAIRLNEPGNDEIKAQCHNNRAAAREHAGDPFRPALIADMNDAIRLKPDYGKAYAKRYRYHMDSGHWREALADLTVVAHFGVMTGVHHEQATCMKHIVTQRVTQWKNELRLSDGERPIPVPHLEVHGLMSCFARDDGLLKDVHAYINGGMRDEGVYSEALKMFTEKQYDEIDTFIKERKNILGERAPECWLLAMIILFLKRRYKEGRALLVPTAHLLDGLPEGERKRGLIISSFIINYFNAETEEQMMYMWQTASREFPSSPDVYTQAYARLSDCHINNHPAAMMVINDRRADQCDLIDQLRQVASLFAGNLADPLTFARQCEEKLRQCGLPTYPTSCLATIYFTMGHRERSLSLGRQIAERDNVGELWYQLSNFAQDEFGREHSAFRKDALRRCLAVDPLHCQANAVMAASANAGRGHDCTLLPRRVIETSVAHAETSLRTFGVAEEQHMLATIINIHECLKAQLRAAEMVGIE